MSPGIEFKEADKESGAQRVLNSASKSAPIFVMDVNEDECQKDTKAISNASCTTNICLPPIAKLLDVYLALNDYDYSCMHITILYLQCLQRLMRNTDANETPGHYSDAMMV